MPFTAPNAPNTSTAQARRSSLADALFTSTQQRVLAPLFGQPGKSFFVTQIMELANSGRGAVQRELERLLAGGLVTVTMMGTQKHYQANPDSPLLSELCGMIQKTVGLVEPIREALESMKEDVDLALIFGSVAKATDSSSSDIDVLIVAEGITLEAAYAALIPVEEMLVRRISPKLYAPDEFRNRCDEGNAFLERVLDGPVIVLIGSLDGA